jgi:hypothetical protein
MKNLIDTVRRRDVVICIGMLSAACLLMLSQHWGMMLSNMDDSWIIRSTWPWAKKTASVQGRFWLIPINLMAGLPYKLGGWPLANVTKITVNALTLLAFAAFIARLINVRFALIVTMSWLALIDVSQGRFNAFHGYLLMFNLQMGVLFLSLWWYLKQIETSKQGVQLIGPYLLFGFATLAYESMLFFSGLYFAVAMYRHTTTVRTPPDTRKKSIDLLRWTILWVRANWVLYAILLAYITVYFGYRHFQPTPGRGLDRGDEISQIVNTIYRFSVYGFHFDIVPLARYTEGVIPVVSLIFSVLFGLCIIFAGLLALPKAGLNPKEVVLRSPIAILVIAFFTFSPNLLHGFVAQYRQWAAIDPYYVGNYLSSFALAVLVACVLVALVGGRKARQEPILFILILYVLGSSATDNMLKWSTLAGTNRRDAALWTEAISGLREPVHASPPGIVHVCGKDSPDKVSGDDDFWSDQLSNELGRRVEFKSKNLNPALCDITIDFNGYRKRAR